MGKVRELWEDKVEEIVARYATDQIDRDEAMRLLRPLIAEASDAKAILDAAKEAFL